MYPRGDVTQLCGDGFARLGWRKRCELQNMRIADVEVPATQTPPPPDPAHWPEDITYRRNEQGIQMREPPAALKAKAKGNPTPPPKATKKPPPPKPTLYPGIPVKQPPDGAAYPAKPASAATAWLDHPPTPPSGQSQEPSGEDESGQGYSTSSSNPWEAMAFPGPPIPAKSSPPASEGTMEVALPSVDEVALRGTAADSSGFQGLHGSGNRYGYADSVGDGSGTSDHGEDREEHACMMVDVSEDDGFVRNQDKFEKLQPVIAIGQHATRRFRRVAGALWQE